MPPHSLLHSRTWYLNPKIKERCQEEEEWGACAYTLLPGRLSPMRIDLLKSSLKRLNGRMLGESALTRKLSDQVVVGGDDHSLCAKNWRGR
jgi:hypothetical protein